MSTTNKMFLDSSFFTEGFRGNHLDFYRFFNTAPVLECFINAVVCSEHWYNLLGLMGSASPLSLKERNRIAATVNKDPLRFSFFRDFIILSMEKHTVELALTFLSKHNLLSNDALILASYIANQIPFIASHDSDFEAPCRAEGIILVTPENYLQVLPKL